MINPPKFQAGDVVSAGKLNQLSSVAAQVMGAYGNVVLGPGAMNVPVQPILRQLKTMASIVPAYSTESGYTHEVGEIVMVVGQNLDKPERGRNQMPVEVKKIDSVLPRTLGIVTTKIEGIKNAGTVALSGTVLALVKRSSGFPGADDDLLAKHGVGFIENDTDTDLTLGFGMGVAEVLWEDTSFAPATDPHWGVVRFPALSTGAKLVKSTAAESGGTIQFKFIDDAEAVHGVAHTLPVLTLPPCE